MPFKKKIFKFVTYNSHTSEKPRLYYMKRKVAIQGIKGGNHHIAALRFFDNDEIECVDCDTFRRLANEVNSNTDSLGIMAVENTIAGSILPNYQILRENNISIIGEYKLRVEHSLVAIKGTKIEDIKEINSHPMALLQCSEFLDSMPNVRRIEKENTAVSAKWIKDNNLTSHAAICPTIVAELYNMEVLKTGIETNKRNFTRFMALAHNDVAEEVLKEINSEKGSTIEEIVDKSSIVFTLPHSPGSLSKVLAILSFYDMNLSMIQSFPIIGQEWQYQFFVNLVFDDYARYKQSIEAIRPLTKEFEILGEYAESKTIE